MSRLPSPLKTVCRVVAVFLGGLLFVRLDTLWQRIRLVGYRTGITAVEQTAPLDSDRFALFVLYEPGNSVPANVKRAVSALRMLHVNVVVLCNHPLSPAQRDWLAPRCHSLILRNNQGFDFGAWKDGVTHLRDTGVQVGRLLFLNDSVFFAGRGLAAMFTRMLAEEDVVAAFENWSETEDHHLQSFAMSLSGAVFDAAPFREFWGSYVPVNNRIHAIERGEKRLSRAVLAAARSTHVIYGTAALHVRLQQHAGSLLTPPERLPKPWRTRLAADAATLPQDRAARLVIDMIDATSPIHAGAYWFPRLMDAPLFKKDLVYRLRFAFWEVESWIAEVLPPDEAEEYLTILRRRGDSSRLRGLDWFKFCIGVK